MKQIFKNYNFLKFRLIKSMAKKKCLLKLGLALLFNFSNYHLNTTTQLF